MNAPDHSPPRKDPAKPCRAKGVQELVTENFVPTTQADSQSEVNREIEHIREERLQIARDYREAIQLCDYRSATHWLLREQDLRNRLMTLTGERWAP